MNFAVYALNVYSENGEDGIIKELLRRIRVVYPVNNWCVEFGAWDGVYASNTCRLIREEGYRAVLIEADKKKVNILKRNHPSESVIVINSFVEFSGENTLDRLLAPHPIPHDFDFLSIDIDGVDYYIFESLQNYQPLVVCIEFNQTIPNGVDFIQAKDYGTSHGSSAKSICALGSIKGYQVAAITNTNIIFIRKDIAELAGVPARDLSWFRPDGEAGITIFQGYDGSLLYSQKEMLLVWHGVPIELAKIQFLPGLLRKFVKNYTFFEWLYFVIFVFIKFPRRSIRFVRRHGWDRILRR